MKCPNEQPHETHWHTILFGGVTVADGQCEGVAEPSPTHWPDGWQREPVSASLGDMGTDAGSAPSGGHSEAQGERAIGAIVTERQRCICKGICLDHCRACNHSGRDLEEACIADPDWEPEDDEDGAPDLSERAERAESVARGQQRLIEAQRAEIERLRQDIDECWVPLYHGVLNERDGLLAEIADRESERADLRDRVEKAEAAVGRVEAALDIRTRARAWMTHLGYEDHQIDKAEEWRQPLEPWLHDDPPQMVLDLDMACGFAREYEQVILAALRGDQ